MNFILASQVIRRTFTSRILISSKMRRLVSAADSVSVPSGNDRNVGKDQVAEIMKIVAGSKLGKFPSMNLISNAHLLERAREAASLQRDAALSERDAARALHDAAHALRLSDRNASNWKVRVITDRLKIANAKVLSLKGSLHARGAMELAELELFKDNHYRKLSRGESWLKHFKDCPKTLTKFLDASKDEPSPAKDAVQVKDHLVIIYQKLSKEIHQANNLGDTVILDANHLPSLYLKYMQILCNVVYLKFEIINEGNVKGEGVEEEVEEDTVETTEGEGVEEEVEEDKVETTKGDGVA